MIDSDLLKRTAIAVSLALTLSSVSVFFGLLSYKFDQAIELQVEDSARIAFLESQSLLKIEMDRYQNQEIKDINQELKDINNAIFVPRTTIVEF